MDPFEHYVNQVEEEKIHIKSELLVQGWQTEVEFGVTDIPGITADMIVTVLAFIFTAVASGFLAEVGKDIWVNIKKAKKPCKRACNRIIKHRKKVHGYHITEIRAEFRLPYGTKMKYVLKYEERLMKGSPVNPIDVFWDTLPDQMMSDYPQIIPPHDIVVVKELKQDPRDRRWVWVTSEG